MGAMRLDKFLTEMQRGSRSQVKELIRKGRVCVNGQLIKGPESKVDPERDEILLDRERVSYAALEYYMLNKPKGVISATEDKRHRTVLDLIPDAKRADLFPVGRLDIDTEGLLLITNDGPLAHRLLSPKKHVDKVYFARVEGEIPRDLPERFAQGIQLLDGSSVLPAKLLLQSDCGGSVRDEAGGTLPLWEAHLTIREGKYHQVKRMFEAFGGTVVYLKRLSMGSLALDPALGPGEYRPLSKEEIEALRD